MSALATDLCPSRRTVATCASIGKANWWLPTWLDRILPHLDIESAPSAPAVSPEPERELVPA